MLYLCVHQSSPLTPHHHPTHSPLCVCSLTYTTTPLHALRAPSNLTPTLCMLGWLVVHAGCRISPTYQPQLLFFAHSFSALPVLSPTGAPTYFCLFPAPLPNPSSVKPLLRHQVITTNLRHTQLTSVSSRRQPRHSFCSCTCTRFCSARSSHAADKHSVWSCWLGWRSTSDHFAQR